VKYSVNPIDKKKYIIPDILDDKNNIELFLSKNKNKKVVVIQGLGFVGAVMAIVVANNPKYAVIGIDLPLIDTYWKIGSINNGIFPIIAQDPKIDEYFKFAKKTGNIYATYDSYAYSKSDIIIVDINLDVNKNNDYHGKLIDYDVDISSFKNAIGTIGDNCRKDVFILIESTVPPGTCEKIVKPIIFERFKKRNLPLNKIKIGHSYERVMPGPNYIDSITNYYRVFSGIDEKSARSTEIFLNSIIKTNKYPLTRLTNTTSTEIAKVLENTYRAINISFIDEWSRFAEEANINLYEVVNAIRVRPTHANLMFPGIGVGGYCLPKDTLLASWSRKNLFFGKGPLSQSEKAISVNDKMPNQVYNFIIKKIPTLSNLKILLLGISYRGDVGDTRNTPVENLYNYLVDLGSEVSCHDPYISYWEEKNLNINQNLKTHFENSYDLYVITTTHTIYNKQKTIDSLLKLDKKIIVDTVGLLSNSNIDLLMAKHKIFVIGRGDL